MPKDHLDQWRHNRDFAASIQPDFPDWAVTAVFYCALHAVDALLKHDRVAGIISHDTRNSTLMRTNRYEKIWRAYQPLHNLSRTVRYLANPGRWIAWKDVESQVVRRYLLPIEQSVQRLMQVNLPIPPLTLQPQ